jgi:hypothetical protein
MGTYALQKMKEPQNVNEYQNVDVGNELQSTNKLTFKPADRKFSNLNDNVSFNDNFPFADQRSTSDDSGIHMKLSHDNKISLIPEESYNMKLEESSADFSQI